MTSIHALLSGDHRQCDDLLAIAELAVEKKEWSNVKAGFADFVAAMTAHFVVEEQVLFPTFEAKTGMSMGPTRVMRMEHEQMRALFCAADAALQAADWDDYLGQVETLVIMMQQHNMKEENILYPMCDQHLTAELGKLLPYLQQGLHSA